MEVRVAADDSFRTWQAKHLKDLSDLEKEYALAVVRESRRPVQAKAVLHLRAIRLAKRNDFQSSIALRQLAKEVEHAEQDDRRERIDAKFDNLRAALFESQRNDLAILNRHLYEELRRVSQALCESLDQPARRLIVKARSLTQTAIFHETTTANTPRTPAQKKFISKTLNEAANQELLRLSGFVLNEASPVAGPTSKGRPLSRRAAGNGSSGQRDLPADVEPGFEAQPAADSPAEEEAQPHEEEEEEDRHEQPEA
jgi:hypothetical protein